jgi:hypothetical protein
MGQPCWNSQRDQTPMIGEFESTAFITSLKVLFTPTFTVATLDDDLYGSRAADSQVKQQSSRKADKECHCTDSLAVLIFRSTLLVRFRRRGETQSSNVRRLFESVIDCHGEKYLHGFVCHC